MTPEGETLWYCEHCHKRVFAPDIYRIDGVENCPVCYKRLTGLGVEDLCDDSREGR